MHTHTHAYQLRVALVDRSCVRSSGGTYGTVISRMNVPHTYVNESHTHMNESHTHTPLEGGTSRQGVWQSVSF